jgi:DNA-binding FadR family transcriptional regulator
VATEPHTEPSRAPGRLRGRGGLYGHVVETLGKEITDGRLPAHQVVYADQLTERFGISRSVVRESVRTLSSMGLLEARPQVGTRVLPIEHWDLLNPRIIEWRGLGPDATAQQRELLELRLGMEPVAARLAAARIDESAGQGIVDAASAMRSALEAKDSFRFFAADSMFHRLLLEGSQNLLLSKFAATIDAGLHVRENLPTTQLSLGAVELHAELAQALINGEGEAAADLATRILEQTLHEFDRAFDKGVDES